MMSKRKISIILCVITLLSPILYANAKGDYSQKDYDNILIVVEGFLNSYENVNLNKSSTAMDFEQFYLDFSLQNKLGQDNNLMPLVSSNIEFVKLLLLRRDIISNNSDSDLTEHNKKLSFKYLDYKISDIYATLKVEVTKTWTYSFSPNIESAAIDTYTINLIYNNDSWDIISVVGLADGFQDITLDKLKDSITQEERIVYLELFTKEFKQLNNERKNEITHTPLLTSSYDSLLSTNYALEYAINQILMNILIIPL